MAKSKWIQIVFASVLYASLLTSASAYVEQQAAIDFCVLKSKSIDSVASLIIKEKLRIRKAMNVAPDDCLLAVIKNLTITGSVEHLKALEVLSSNSDGYVSEALMDAAADLFQRDAVRFVNYLNSNPHASLFKSLTDGLSMMCSVESVKPEELKFRFISKMKSDVQKKTLDLIFRNVDPKKFD
jgi:hypothetical protein